jgi:hypothetical protein
MRCNCQMSFSSSFERPRFKLRCHKKRMDNTTRIGRPLASVTSTMRKSSESTGVRDWVNGASKCRLLEAGYSSAAVLTTNRFRAVKLLQKCPLPYLIRSQSVVAVPGASGAAVIAGETVRSSLDGHWWNTRPKSTCGRYWRGLWRFFVPQDGRWDEGFVNIRHFGQFSLFLFSSSYSLPSIPSVYWYY